MNHTARFVLLLPLTLAGCSDSNNSPAETDGPASTSSPTQPTAEATSTAADPSTGMTGPTADDTGPSGNDTGSSGDATGGSGASSSTGDPFVGCARGAHAPDIQDANWIGPGVDPKTGALVDDGASLYVVSSTYLALRADADFGLFGELSEANAEALFSNPGMVATQLTFAGSCAAARTLTVWESQDALMAFVGGDAHLASVSAFPSLSRGGSALTIWPDPVLASEIVWETALQRMADEVPYD